MNILAENTYIEKEEDMHIRETEEKMDLLLIETGTKERLLCSLKEKADKGDEESMCDLAYIYMYGLAGEEENEEEGYGWAKLAYENKAKYAYRVLGDYFSKEESSHLNLTFAFLYFFDGAQKDVNDFYAVNRIACGEWSVSSDENRKRIFLLLQASFEAGNGKVSLPLAQCHRIGFGTEKNLRLYAKTLERGWAEYKDDNALQDLITCYRCGIGVEKDEKHAKRLESIGGLESRSPASI